MINHHLILVFGQLYLKAYNKLVQKQLKMVIKANKTLFPQY